MNIEEYELIDIAYQRFIKSLPERDEWGDFTSQKAVFRAGYYAGKEAAIKEHANI